MQWMPCLDVARLFIPPCSSGYLLGCVFFTARGAGPEPGWSEMGTSHKKRVMNGDCC